jgi:hypothetical protein
MGVGAVAVKSADAERSQFYTGATTCYVVIVAIVAASGGLIFGFDNSEGVISLQDRCYPTQEQHIWLDSALACCCWLQDRCYLHRDSTHE